MTARTDRPHITEYRSQLVDAAAALLRAGHNVALIGPSGSGRTLCAHRISQTVPNVTVVDPWTADPQPSGLVVHPRHETRLIDRLPEADDRPMLVTTSERNRQTFVDRGFAIVPLVLDAPADRNPR